MASNRGEPCHWALPQQAQERIDTADPVLYTYPIPQKRGPMAQNQGSMLLGGVRVAFDWTPQNGASATVPSIMVGVSGFPGDPPDWNLLVKSLRDYDAECRIACVDWAAAGYAPAPETLRRAIAPGWWADGEDQPIWVRPGAPLGLGSPFVAVDRRDIAPIDTFHWFLGYAGLPQASGVLVPGSTPPSQVIARAAEHMRQDSESVQVATYLGSPETLDTAQFNWSVASGELRLATTVSRKDHQVPYTRVARVLHEARNSPHHRVGRVYAFAVTRADGQVVTPAVLVATSSSRDAVLTESIVSTLAAEGLTEVQPYWRPLEETSHVAHFRARKRLFCRDPALFAEVDTRAWVAEKADACSGFSADSVHRSATF